MPSPWLRPAAALSSLPGVLDPAWGVRGFHLPPSLNHLLNIFIFVYTKIIPKRHENVKTFIMKNILPSKWAIFEDLFY